MWMVAVMESLFHTDVSYVPFSPSKIPELKVLFFIF